MLRKKNQIYSRYKNVYMAAYKKLIKHVSFRDNM